MRLRFYGQVMVAAVAVALTLVDQVDAAHLPVQRDEQRQALTQRLSFLDTPYDHDYSGMAQLDTHSDTQAFGRGSTQTGSKAKVQTQGATVAEAETKTASETGTGTGASTLAKPSAVAGARSVLHSALKSRAKQHTALAQQPGTGASPNAAAIKQMQSATSQTTSRLISMLDRLSARLGNVGGAGGGLAGGRAGMPLDEELALLKMQADQRAALAKKSSQKEQVVGAKMNEALKAKDKLLQEQAIKKNKEFALQDRRRNLALVQAERKQNAVAAVRSVMNEQKKKKKAEEIKQKKKEKFEAFLHQKKIKREWKELQDSMLKMLTEKLKTWKFRGTLDARRELYEMLEAASAALKAQYFETTQGLDPEAGAEKAAEKAIASLGKFADEQTKHMMAKKAADLYIKQDGERKKAIDMLDRAIKLLGPVEKSRANPYLTKCVQRVRSIIDQSNATKKKVPTSCDMIAEGIEQRLTAGSGNPFAFRLADGSVNPLIYDQGSASGQVSADGTPAYNPDGTPMNQGQFYGLGQGQGTGSGSMGGANGRGQNGGSSFQIPQLSGLKRNGTVEQQQQKQSNKPKSKPQQKWDQVDIPSDYHIALNVK